jgi:hypothetical protein
MGRFPTKEPVCSSTSIQVSTLSSTTFTQLKKETILGNCPLPYVPSINIVKIRNRSVRTLRSRIKPRLKVETIKKSLKV